MVRWKMDKKEIIKNRVNFLYYDQDMTQESIGKVLKISRQTVNKILNSNEEHEKLKLKRIENKKITRKVQFKKNTSPTISIPKDMLEKIGIDPEKNEAEIKDDKYIEVGKSGKKFNKKDVINDLSILKEDRKINIYNFTCDKIDEKTYLIHYITKNDNDNIYRTSIWKKEYNKIKIIFHQASLYKENITLVEY